MSQVFVRNLTKRYGQAVVVNEVSLDVAQGEFVTLLGSSGCGKTTTLRCVAGLEEADGGDVLFDDRPMAGVPSWERSCGMVFQNYALFPHMTLAGNVAYGLVARRYRTGSWAGRAGLLLRSPLAVLSDAERRQVQAALERVELGGFEARRPGQLSGGQQQRVALARALVTEPKVLLFDEPLGALDARLRVKMREEIRRIQRQAGITTLYVTHDQEEALAISDRIAVMHKGVIAQLGTPEELYRRPRTRFVADFIGVENILDGPGAGRLGLPAEAPCIGFRADQVRLSRAGAGCQGVVRMRMFMGTLFRYVVQVDSVEVVVHQPQDAPLWEVEAPVRVEVPAEALLTLSQD